MILPPPPLSSPLCVQAGAAAAEAAVRLGADVSVFSASARRLPRLRRRLMEAGGEDLRRRLLAEGEGGDGGGEGGGGDERGATDIASRAAAAGAAPPPALTLTAGASREQLEAVRGPLPPLLPHTLRRPPPPSPQHVLSTAAAPLNHDFGEGELEPAFAF